MEWIYLIVIEVELSFFCEIRVKSRYNLYYILRKVILELEKVNIKVGLDCLLVLEKLFNFFYCGNKKCIILVLRMLFVNIYL